MHELSKYCGKNGGCMMNCLASILATSKQADQNLGFGNFFKFNIGACIEFCLDLKLYLTLDMLRPFC